MKKFELTTDFITVFGIKLFRIKALVEFGDIKAGEIGGYVQKEENLDQSGNAWVFGNAQVYGNAQVFGNARVSGNAQVFGDAQVSGDAWVFGDARVRGNARVHGDAQVRGNAWVHGNADVYGNADVHGDAQVHGNADVLQITGLGTVHRTTTAFRTKDDIKISCGCFFGNLEEFKRQVVKTRDGKVKDEYLKFADLIEIYFEFDKKEKPGTPRQ